jgi:hypothetical protein
LSGPFSIGPLGVPAFGFFVASRVGALNAESKSGPVGAESESVPVEAAKPRPVGAESKSGPVAAATESGPAGSLLTLVTSATAEDATPTITPHRGQRSRDAGTS